MSRHSEAGDTLVEVLIALVVLGLASVAMMMAFATTISATAEQRNLATFDTVLRSASEEVITQIQQQPAALFESCSGAAQVAFSLPSGYTAQITTVKYWNGSIFAAACTPNAAQLITLTVTDATSGRTYTNNFVVDDPLARPVVTPGAAAQLAFVVQPGNSTMSSTLSPEPVVAVEDASGNIVTTDLSPVTLTITSGTGTSGASLSASCSGTEFYGVVTFSGCEIATSGSGYTLTATDSNLTSAISNSFSVSTGQPTQLVITTQPGSSSGGSSLSIQPVVAIEDANGNLVTTDASVVTLVMTPGTGSSGAIISGCSEAESSGVVTFSGCTVNLAGSGYTLSATDGSLRSAISASFNVAVGTAAQLVFTTQPSAGASSSTLNTQPVVKVEDASGNVVTTSSATITLTPSGGTLSSCAGLSASSGVVTVSGCAFAGLVGKSYSLTASSGILVSGVSGSFSPTIHGPAARLVFTTQTAGVANSDPSTPFSTQPVVSIEDSAGNLITNFVSPVTLSVSTGSSLTCSSGFVLTPVNGAASFTGCHVVTFATGVTLTASTSNLPNATSPAFNVTNVPTQLSFSVQPSATADNYPIAPSVQVSVEDSAGRVVTTSSSAVAIAIGTNPGSGTLSGTATETAVDGVATFADLSINHLGTGFTLTAASTGLTPTISNPFNVTVGPAFQLVLTTQPVSTNSGSAFTTQPVIDVEDASGNVVTTSSAAITLAASGGTLSSCAALSASSGVVTVTGCTFAGVVGTNYTLTAASSGLTSATSSNFSPSVAGTATKLVFTTQPVSTNSGSAFTTKPVVKVEDASGNVVTTSSATITLAASGGSLSSCAALSASSGVVTVTGCTFAGLVGTNYTLTAASSGLTSATSNTFSPSGAGTAAKLVFIVLPASGISGAALTTEPVIDIQDASGNVVTTSSAAITLAASGGSLSSCAGLSASSGVVTVTGCTFAGLVGTNYTLTAASSGLTSATSNTFSPSGAGTATKLVFTTQPVSTASGSTFTTQPVIDIQDASGNVVTTSSAAITLAASGGSLSSCAGLSASSGVVTVTGCTFAGLVGTNYTLTAASSGLTSATSSNFSPSVAGTATKLVFTTQPVSTTSGSAFTTKPVVKVEDASGNVVTTSSATITLSASGGSLSSCAGLSASSGVVTVTGCTFAGLVGTNYTLTAASSGLTSATSSNFSPSVAGTATKLVFTTQPVSTNSGSAFTTKPVVKVEDASGNVVTTSSATITLAASGGSLSSCAALSASSGVVTVTGCTFAGLVGTNYTLTAASSGLTSATSSNFSPSGAGTAAQLVFTTQTTGVASSSATSTFTIQPVATVEDSVGNVVTNYAASVTLSVSSGETLACSGGTSMTPSSGVAAFTGCHGSAYGIGITLTAASSGLTSVTSATFNITGVASKLAFTTQPTSGTHGTTISPAVVVSVEDASGRVVTTSSALVAMSLGSGSGSLSGTSPITAAGGVATFSDLSMSKSGTDTFSATSSGLTSATSSSFTES